MKKIILLIISLAFTFGVNAQNLVQADSTWNVIKNETVRGANTAERIGNAGNAIIAGIRDTLANFVSDALALSLGETDVTAYRGDRGKIAYDFSQGTGVTDLADFNSKIETLTGYLYPNTSGIIITENYTLLYAFVKPLFSNVRIVTAYVIDGSDDKTTIFQKVGYLAGGVWSWENWQNVDKSEGINASLEVDSVVTAQTFQNGVWDKFTSFNKVGLHENCTAVADSIVITKTGKYEVQFNFCSKSATNNVNIETCVFVNGVKNSAHTIRYLAAVNADCNVSCSRSISLTAGDVLDVRVKHDNASPVDITTSYGSFSVNYIGK